MRKILLLYSAGIIFLSQVQAQQPVLAWSAKVGPLSQSITGTAVAADGSVYIVSRTSSSNVFDDKSFRNSDIFIGKLSSDGSALSCRVVIGGNSEDIPRVVALAPDGTIIVAGITQSADFPRMPAGPPQATQDPRSFLLRVDPCDTKIRYSI